ncbi:protein cordon-bleu isoform X1 [Lates japonicus]|uniref:Protein cordon-bleu isoform X1 n=1 Tax=Lates japonicus TaxID=270547 RepID=A0AAD3R667_LATJO|nr:protein cordon-bleu isoform X1 [Lates japonicus]
MQISLYPLPAWLHSSSAARGQKPETETPEEETVSLGSSSGGSSLPDQGYAASEGMGEGEDSGMVSSPSDTQPTSPDGSLSLDGSSGGRGERLPRPVRDNSSDSDEGCATWGSRHRHNDITAQLHQTLADFEADLADHIDIVSAKETPYTMSTDSNEVPVSVVDMDVPVTAIDEVLEDYERNIVENEAKSLRRTESAGSKGPGFCQQSSAIKIDDQGNMVKVGISRNRVGGSSESGINCSEGKQSLAAVGSPLLGKAKAFWSSNERQETVVPHSKVQINKAKENMDDEKRDLSFLKPSRRTSSQYVASAITKNTPKTPAKLNSIHNVPDSSASMKTQTIGFQRSGRSIQVNPHQSSQSTLSDIKEGDSASKLNPSGTKRFMSHPEYVSDSQRDSGEVKPNRGGFGSCVGLAKGSSNTLETETAKNKHIQSSGPTQINVAANNDRDNIKHIRPRSPNPAQSSPQLSSAKPPTAPKTISQDQRSNTRDMTKAATHLTPDARPQPSVKVSDGDDVSQPVTLFGPVKKFRPVISRSVEKETSLHSSLMEAIQMGGGRDRLKKISTNGPSSMKNASYVEEDNERSALLAAIRGQNNSGRLKKTKSEAADELERFRKVASEKERSADAPSSSSLPSLNSTSPSVLTPPPPPPPAPVVAPPPPPPVLPQGKPSSVTHPSANTPMNPALAREAMLEAIRSGSAAGRLKKVTVPTKTVQVNGRLGTIQATSSAVPQQ